MHLSKRGGGRPALLVCKKEDDFAYPDANGSTLTCTLCKAEVITIESKLQDKDFLATLESEVEKVCAVVPSQEAVCDGLDDGGTTAASAESRGSCCIVLEEQLLLASTGRRPGGRFREVS